MRKYRPSNGTEGECFISKWCGNCFYENPDPEKTPNCSVLSDTMCYSLNDPEYPKEWQYNENDKPICTKFKKWDWGNDGDPNDPNNPNYVQPDDPNQLCLPFVANEISKENNFQSVT